METTIVALASESIALDKIKKPRKPTKKKDKPSLMFIREKCTVSFD